MRKKARGAKPHKPKKKRSYKKGGTTYKKGGKKK